MSARKTVGEHLVDLLEARGVDTVFGIPGDAITAIVISVMFIKGINPGPTLFLNRPEVIYGIFAIFFVANLLIIPLGIACIYSFRSIMKLPTAVISNSPGNWKPLPSRFASLKSIGCITCRPGPVRCC